MKLIKVGMILHFCLNSVALITGGVCSFTGADCDPYMNGIYYGIPIYSQLNVFGVLLFIILSVVFCSLSYVYTWKYENYAMDYEDQLHYDHYMAEQHAA